LPGGLFTGVRGIVILRTSHLVLSRKLPLPKLPRDALDSSRWHHALVAQSTDSQTDEPVGSYSERCGGQHGQKDRAVALLCSVGAFLVLAVAGALYQLIATEVDQRRYPPPGELVDVGGYRLHAHCIGQGSPTVILDHLGEGMSSQWAWVQREVSNVTRVCAYDRAGFGWSDPEPAPRDALSSAREVEVLLRNGSIDGPYVLVGHSYGANVARLYASEHPDEVAGMMLVDPGLLPGDPRLPSGSDAEAEEPLIVPFMRVLNRVGVVRLSGICGGFSEGLPSPQRAQYCASYNTPRYWATLHDQHAAMDATAEQVRGSGALGEVPLVVLSATVPQDELRRAWTGINAELANSLSSEGFHREVEGATHESLALERDDAAVTSRSIVSVVEAARSARALNGIAPEGSAATRRGARG
jgi:pimeloyl-ACP methyl ester carboxylesterase